MTGSDVEVDLWRFAISVYGAEGVSEDCLKLQERFGVDVPMILCTLWMATRGNVLDPDGMARLAVAVGPWHDEVVKALREVRRRLKSGPAPAPNDRTEIIRNAVKAAEVNAERLELAVLAELVEAEFAPGAAVLPAQNLAVALAHYAGRPVGDEAPLDRLSRAAEAAAKG